MLRDMANRRHRKYQKPLTPFDHWMELDVGLDCIRSGYAVKPKAQFATVEIPLVIENRSRCIAVLIDCDHWYSEQNFNITQAPLAVLDRGGWQTARIRESLYYADKSTTMSALWQVLSGDEVDEAAQAVGGLLIPQLREFLQLADFSSTP